MTALLEVQDLQLEFVTAHGVLKALNGISFDVGQREIFGLVGETGCGKTVTGLSILRLLPKSARIGNGKILFNGKNLLLLSLSEMEALRGRDIAMIFQGHTSGLHDTSAFDESDLFGATDPGAMARWVDEQKGQVPYAPPGRFWNYSSANYMYAGHILELVTGQSYPDYMDQRVFRPVGMADTTLHAEEAVTRGNFAYGHYRSPFSGRLEIYDLNEANNWARHPTGYANSTAGDLVRLAGLVMAQGGGVLSPESSKGMQTRQQYRDLRQDQYYGLGTLIVWRRYSDFSSKMNDANVIKTGPGPFAPY